MKWRTRFLRHRLSGFRLVLKLFLLDLALSGAVVQATDDATPARSRIAASRLVGKLLNWRSRLETLRARP